MSLAVQSTAPPSSYVPLQPWVQRPGEQGSKFTSWWTASILTSAQWGVKPSAMSPTRSSTRWTATTPANRTTTNLAASSLWRSVPLMKSTCLWTAFKKWPQSASSVSWLQDICEKHQLQEHNAAHDMINVADKSRCTSMFSRERTWIWPSTSTR